DGQLDPGRLLAGLKEGLVDAANDPYTAYFNPEDAKTFNEALTGSFIGIGAELGTDADNNIVIISPLSGYPAEKAGLKPKDIIAAVNGQLVTGVSVDKVVQKIRGAAGVAVKLTIKRGADKPFELSITRERITIPSVESSVEGAIGYLKISQFTNDTTKLAKKVADDFKAQGVKAIILDLRGNPGGYLKTATEISSLWLDKGKTVVSERRGGQTLSTDYALGGNVFKSLPTVVLINSGSASASEITAGALRDNGVATIVGEKSFGKGSVQQVESLSGGGELKVTIARWFTPVGENIDKQGIAPDITITMSDTDVAAGKDPQKDKATQILTAKIQ
ncbi:MAG: S41 family peptidase, partial [Patescibacteria group bacterium]